MKTRSILKRVIVVLCIFLCAEIGLFVFRIHSGTSAYARNLDLGNKYLLSEDYDSAISAFSKAIEIDSMNADAYIGRGDAYKAIGDYASAWEDYEKAQELSGNEDILSEKIGATEITVVSEDGKGVDDVAVKLNGSSHSYEFMTDTTGHISEVIFPEKYIMEVVKDKFEPVETELSAEGGGTEHGRIQLRREIDEKEHTLPVIEIENIHETGGNSRYTMDYSRVSLVDGTDTVLPELAAALDSYNAEIVGIVLQTVNEDDMLRTVAMQLTLTIADKSMVSLHYDYSNYSGGARGVHREGGASFDKKTGTRLTLGDICTDMEELARIIAAAIYVEEADRFTISEEEMVQVIMERGVNSDNKDYWFITPEGLYFYFPPDTITHDDAAPPNVFVRFLDYPHIFNESYVSR